MKSNWWAENVCHVMRGQREGRNLKEKRGTVDDLFLTMFRCKLTFGI